MAASDTRELKVVIDGDGKGGEKALKDVGGGLEHLDEQREKSHDGWKKFGAALAAVTAVAAVGLAKLAIDSTKLASDLGETQSKVGVVFGAAASQIEAFADKAAVTMGQSKQAVLDGAATFALYGKQAGLAGGDLVGFSTNLSSLASDMASFSNASPEEAIAAIGSAMRGESDPIERFGVLINETVLKNAALKAGIIKTTKEALTPQQRVLAVQTALYEQLGAAGSGTLGDFARTSGSLANQQRILSSQWTNWKTQIGTALVPVVTQFVTLLNTKLMPILTDLWAKHGPAVTSFLARMGEKLGQLGEKMGRIDWKQLGTETLARLREVWDSLKGVDFSGFFSKMKEALTGLGPQMKEVSGSTGKSLADMLNVAGVAFKFAADHADLLAKALPYLVTGFVLFKTAQGAFNIVQAASPLFRIAEVIANYKLAGSYAAMTASMQANTAAMASNRVATVGSTVATTAQDVATKRSIVSWIASKAVLIGQAIATAAATVQQWALNIAMSLNPLGIVILAIVALVAIIVVLWKKNEGFRKIVLAVWNAIKVAVSAVVDWIKKFVPMAWDAIVQATKFYFALFQKFIIDPIIAVKDFIVAGIAFYIKLFTDGWAWIVETTKAAWEFYTTLITNAITTVRDVIATVLEFVRAVVVGAWTFITERTSAAWNAAVSFVTNAVNNLLAWVRYLRDQILGIFASAKDWLTNAGRSIIDGLLGGIQSGFDKVKKKLKELTNLLPSWKGPASKDEIILRPAGQKILGGLVKGFDDATPTVHGRLTKLTTDIQSGRGLASRSVASSRAAAAAGVNVTVNVAGSVTAERDLADSIALRVQNQITRNDKRNGR